MPALAMILAIAVTPSGTTGCVWNREDTVRWPGSSWATVSAKQNKDIRACSASSILPILAGP